MGLGSYKKTTPITRIGAVGDAKPINLNNRGDYTRGGGLCQIGPSWLGFTFQEAQGPAGTRFLEGGDGFDSDHLCWLGGRVLGCPQTVTPPEI